MTGSAWWLNLHQPEVSHRAHWDTVHLQAALTAAGISSHEGPDAPPDPSVVLIAGQHHTPAEDVTRINGLLQPYDRLVVIVTSDEASLFPWHEVDRPGIQWWISTPRKSVHGILATRDSPDGPTRFFGEGAGPPVSLPPVAKDLDVYFGGQITHARRQELAAVLRPLQSETVVLEETAGFMQGRGRPGYLSMLARARVAPAPAGPGTTCSFRCWEALSLGCIPVVENYTPDGIDHDQWEMVYGHAGPLPFPALDSWEQLPDFLPYLLHDFDRISRECQTWWADRQAELVTWLRTALGLGA